MKWFKHDTDATTDAKLKKVLIHYGVTGYAIYFHCLELIASDISESNLTFELEHDAEIIADDLRIKGDGSKSGTEIVSEIMQFMVSINLFEENNGHIFCFKLLQRLDQSMATGKLRKIIEEKKNHDNVMINHDNVMLEEKRREQNKTYQNKTESDREIDDSHEDSNSLSQGELSVPGSDYPKLIYDMWCNNDFNLPKSKDYFSFVSTEFRLAHQYIRGIHSDDVIKAINNYFEVLRKSLFYQHKYTFAKFASKINDFLPDFFRLENYTDRSPSKKNEKPIREFDKDGLDDYVDGIQDWDNQG